MPDTAFFPALGNGLADWIMALAAVASVAASVFAIVLAFKSLKAAQDANATSAQAVADTKETGKKQVRAYVAAMQFTVSAPAPGFPVGIDILWKNMGQTPAHDVRSGSVALFTVIDSTEYIEAEIRDGTSSTVLAANDALTSPLVTVAFDSDMYAALVKGSHGLLLVARCTYVDVFNEEHETQLRVMYVRNQKAWVPIVAGYGNEMN